MIIHNNYFFYIFFFIFGFSVLLSQNYNNASNEAVEQEKSYKIIYIFSINDCSLCIESINKEIECLNNSLDSLDYVEICGYILADRKLEQKDFIKRKKWKFCVNDEIINIRKKFNLHPTTQWALFDKDGEKVLEFSIDFARSHSICQIVKDYLISIETLN